MKSNSISNALQTKAMSLDSRSLENIKTASRGAKDSEAFDQAIKESAKQFESLFLTWVLESMRKASPEGGLFNDQATKAYQNLYDKELVQHLSGKGLGLASEIERQLKSLVNNKS